MSGYYYLHTNGDLIYKPRTDDGVEADLRESDFVRAFWPVSEDRLSAWDMLLAADLLGADVRPLLEKWKIDDADAGFYAAHCGLLIDRDGNKWCATGPNFDNLAVSPAGFGNTWFDAIVGLLCDSKFPQPKTWGVPASQWLNEHT